MLGANTLYAIGGLPSVAANRIDWPAAGADNYLMRNGGDSNSAYMHAGYGGSVFVPDIGAYGTMVFGTTGEGVISNQLTKFSLSDDDPQWGLYQQPMYPTTLAEADTMDADAYYNEADNAAIPSAKRIGDVVSEGTFASTWGGDFPVGKFGWVIRRKYTAGGLTGEQRPWFFRYEMPQVIPASMTGTGSSAIIVTNLGTIYGPFAQGATIPSSGADGRWFADVSGSGRRKYYVWAKDTGTGKWERLAPALPDVPVQPSTIFPMVAVNETTRRVHFWVNNSSSNSTFYVDFSGGLAGATVSPLVALTDQTGGAPVAFGAAANHVLCVPTRGALAGKHIYLCRNYTRSDILLWDIENATLSKLTITGLGTDSWWGMSYDPATNRVYLCTKDLTNGVRYRYFTIPDDYTNSAAYSLSGHVTVAPNGVTLESSADSDPWQYGQRTRFHSGLGVILMTQKFHKMLAFRPA